MTTQQNQLIKKKHITIREKKLLNHQAEFLENPVPDETLFFEPSKPLEVTEEAKIKMRQLMDDFLVLQEKDI